jgi:LuxR family maltose regulon positive regulatory protein
VPEARRHRAKTAVATVQLLQARRLADVETGIQAAGAMFDGEGADETVSVELRALGLMNLGLAENGVLRLKESSEHLERALALGRQVKRAYIELGCLVGLGVVATMSRRSGEAEDLLRQAIELADRLGWSNHPNVAVGCVTLGQVLIDRGGFEEGEQLLERAEPILVSAPELAGTVALRHAQGMLEFGRGRFAEALAAFRDGERLVAQLRAPHFLGEVERQWQLRAQLRLGEIEPARGALEEARAAGMSGSADWCNLEALVRLQTGDAAATLEAVAPVLAGEAYVVHVNREIEAWLLDGLARQQLEDVKGARDSVERALELAECQGSVWVFLTVGGAAELLEAHPVHTSAHGAHIRLLLDRVAGVAEPPGAEATPELSEALSERELAVLRFMPTNLSAAEIGAELFLSVHTVKTHMRRLYAKLDVHTRAEAVQRGRALGLLAPGLRGR